MNAQQKELWRNRISFSLILATIFVLVFALSKALGFVGSLAPPLGKIVVWSFFAWVAYGMWCDYRDDKIEDAKREARIKKSTEWERRRKAIDHPAVQKSLKRHHRKLYKRVPPLWSKKAI